MVLAHFLNEDALEDCAPTEHYMKHVIFLNQLYVVHVITPCVIHLSLWQ